MFFMTVCSTQFASCAVCTDLNSDDVPECLVCKPGFVVKEDGSECIGQFLNQLFLSGLDLYTYLYFKTILLKEKSQHIK